MIILACGGRKYSDLETIDLALRRYINPFDKDSILITGGATGADYLVTRWARKHGIHCAIINALWEHYDKDAGPSRNRAMLLLRPEMVVAFPGGGGTENTCRQAREMGIDVVRVGGDHRHKWTTDGHHTNVFCSVCFKDRPESKLDSST